MKKPTFKRPQIKRPALPSMKPAPDPLKGLKPTDSFEGDTEHELDALQEGFRDRAAQEAKRFEDATDSGYYTCLVCMNRDQLDALLTGLRGLGMQIAEDMFLDGRELARVLNIELPPATFPGSAAKIDRTFAEMARDD